MCTKQNERSCFWRITVAAGGGKETRKSRPSVSALQRKTKVGSDEEVAYLDKGLQRRLVLSAKEGILLAPRRQEMP